MVVENENCGKKFLKNKAHDWKKGPLPCNQIVVILGKRFDVAGCVVKMYVKTAYPV